VTQQNIDARTLRDMLEHDERIMVVDVRKQEDHAEGSIPGSVNFDAYDALHAGDERAMEEFRAAGGCASGHRVQPRTLQRGGRGAVAAAGT
jgi:rhodanese-related sulfurtransferase